MPMLMLILSFRMWFFHSIFPKSQALAAFKEGFTGEVESPLGIIAGLGYAGGHQELYEILHHIGRV